MNPDQILLETQKHNLANLKGERDYKAKLLYNLDANILALELHIADLEVKLAPKPTVIG